MKCRQKCQGDPWQRISHCRKEIAAEFRDREREREHKRKTERERETVEGIN